MSQYKIWLGLVVFLLLWISTYAATIENVKAEIDEHDRLVVTYDYNGSPAGAIHLSISQDGGESFDCPLSISGDVGPGVKPGSGRRIIWDIFMDSRVLQTDRLVARVSIVPPEELASVLVPKQKVTGPSRQLRPVKPSPRKLTRTKLMLQSVIVPGWGQVATGRKRGYLYMVGCATALGAAYFANTYYENEIKKYNIEQELYLRPYQIYSTRKSHEDAMMKHYDNMKLYRDVNFAAFIAAGLIYGWNLIEMGTVNLGGSSSRLSMDWGNDRTSFIPMLSIIIQ